MSCCGKKRAQARQATQARKSSKPTINKSSEPESKHDTAIYFQYLGQRKLTVVGPNTGKHYRFDGPGSVIEVDPKDKGPLSAVTALRQVTKVRNNALEF